MAEQQKDKSCIVPLTELRSISSIELSARLEQVKELANGENDAYRLVKDAATGDHYLHYAVRHLNVAAGGAEEEYHHLLPLEHDDVIALALGGPLPAYPSEWTRAYLRNGPSDAFVWYDPTGAGETQEAAFEAAAAALREKLLAFKREGKHSEADVRKLLEETERLFPPSL